MLLGLDYYMFLLCSIDSSGGKLSPALTCSTLLAVLCLFYASDSIKTSYFVTCLPGKVLILRLLNLFHVAISELFSFGRKY